LSWAASSCKSCSPYSLFWYFPTHPLPQDLIYLLFP
jgi:hypothetical protein